MKTRQGFVSNSSTSSYICDVCGNERSGMDLDISEAEMHQCANGHTFCDEHTNIDLGDTEIRRQFMLAHRLTSDEDCEKLSSLSWEGLEEFVDELWDNDDYEGEFRYNTPVNFCPVCKFDALTNRDIAEYLMTSLGVMRDDVKIALKLKFANYDDFKKYVGRK